MSICLLFLNERQRQQPIKIIQKCTIEKLDNQSNKPHWKRDYKLAFVYMHYKSKPHENIETRLGQWQFFFEKLEN